MLEILSRVRIKQMKMKKNMTSSDVEKFTSDGGEKNISYVSYY